MLGKVAAAPAFLIRRNMEIITSDGKRAGYVNSVESGEIISHSPCRRFPLSWIRRIDHDDVYIARRLSQIEDA